jgi:hypothetical protein
MTINGRRRPIEYFAYMNKGIINNLPTSEFVVPSVPDEE